MVLELAECANLNSLSNRKIMKL
uniref:Uncharacterized protein n=1 Tax=Anguilla anguilla TaxID=7936 RepID=A0A0E9XN13_ANGAN